jgi:hypothetical protein
MASIGEGSISKVSDVFAATEFDNAAVALGLGEAA